MLGIRHCRDVFVESGVSIHRFVMLRVAVTRTNTPNDDSIAARIVDFLPEAHSRVILVFIALAKLNEVRELVSCGNTPLMLRQSGKRVQR